MSNFLAAPLNEMFGRPSSPKPKAATRVVAIIGGVELPINKRGKFWTIQIPSRVVGNSRLGDLIQQLEDDFGATVERRAL